MRKRRRLYVILLVVWCALLPVCMAQEYNTNTVLESQLDLLDWNSIEDVEEKLREAAPYIEDFDLTREVTGLVTGQTKFSLEYILEKIVRLIIDESGVYLNLIARFVLIAIMCSLLQTLSASFKSQQTTKAAFFVCYLFVIFIISQSLIVVVDLASSTISHLSEIMMATLPTLLAFMAISGYITSSSALATVMIAVINLMTFIVKTIVLPIVVGLIVLQVIGTMSEEIKIDKFVQLFYKAVRWSLRGIFILSVGIMGIYKLTQIGRASCRERVYVLV